MVLAARRRWSPARSGRTGPTSSPSGSGSAGAAASCSGCVDGSATIAGRRGLGAHDGGAAGRRSRSRRSSSISARALFSARRSSAASASTAATRSSTFASASASRAASAVRVLGAQALHRLVAGGQLGLELRQARRELLARVALAAHLGLEALALAALAVRPAERGGRRLAGLVGERAQRVGLAREPHVEVARAVRALVAVRRGQVEQLAPDRQGVFGARQEP